MNKHLQFHKYLYPLTIFILLVSLLLSGCGGGVLVDEGREVVTQEEEEPPIEPMHPSFSFSDLVIEPTRVICSEEVTITVSITNIGENREKYDSLLNINGIEEETKSITLEPGTTGILSYNIVRDIPGIYDVEMSGLTGSFTVIQSEITESTSLPSKITTSGWITEDEIWSGTVRITGDVWVDGDTTLTILPGTTILFAAHQDDQHAGFAVPLDDWIAQHDDPTWTLEYRESHSKLDVYGTLIAQGTPDNMITFTSDSPTPDGGDWVHLHIGYGSIVEYCIIEYSIGGLDVKEKTEDSVTISNNIIRNNFWSAIGIHYSSPNITHNKIINSGAHQGIAVIGEGSTPYIAYNTFTGCKSGINIQPGSKPIVEYNTFIDNDSGIGLIGSDDSTIVRYNSISSPNGPPKNWTYRGEPIYFSSILLGRDDAISGISISDCSPLITNNNISHCNSAGINIMGNSSPTIKHNTITDNHAGILLDESFIGSPTIEENNILNSTHANISLWSSQPIIAANNWWGTTDLAEIQAMILNMGGKLAPELVTIEPILTEPVEIE